MAIITCKECGGAVSDKAYTCPHCGTVLIEKEHPQDVICTECGKAIPNGLDSCPNCGCPVTTAKTETIIQTPATNNNSVMSSFLKPVIIIVLSISLLIGIIYISQNTLTGDNKIAYDLLIEASKKFKNPSSVRLVSGVLGVDKDCLMCGISATNGFGTRTTSYYYISNEGWILEQDNPASFYKDIDKLNIKLINKKLEKALGQY